MGFFALIWSSMCIVHTERKGVWRIWHSDSVMSFLVSHHSEPWNLWPFISHFQGNPLPLPSPNVVVSNMWCSVLNLSMDLYYTYFTFHFCPISLRTLQLLSPRFIYGVIVSSLKSIIYSNYFYNLQLSN